MIQIDGPQRRVYIKFHTEEWVTSILQATERGVEFRHENGELSTVHIELAGMGYRRIRLANLPPEIPDHVIRETLAPYVEVKEVHEETWSKAYRYPVYNGIRIAMTQLKNHLPSHMVIAGTRILVSYEGQPPTCYVCNAQGHQSIDCPRRKNTDVKPAGVVRHSWADVVTRVGRHDE
jgi:hypothetical protein